MPAPRRSHRRSRLRRHLRPHRQTERHPAGERRDAGDGAPPLRLKILCLVGNQELSVLEIVDAVGTTQSNISQHLAVLRDHGILQSRKEANKVFYRIEDPRILKMIALTREIFCSF
jgi:ArsR family transcriptional regulator